MSRGNERRSGKVVPIEEYWKTLQNLWLAVEGRGVEIQMINNGRNAENNKTLQLAVEANRSGRTSRFKFLLLASDVLGLFNIPCSKSSSEGKTIEEEGADKERISGEEMSETEEDDMSGEGTNEEGTDEDTGSKDMD